MRDAADFMLFGVVAFSAGLAAGVAICLVLGKL